MRQRLVTLSPCHFVASFAIASLVLALALLPLSTLALALFYSLLILLALIDPIFGVYWAILSVPVQEVVHVPGGMSYTQAAMLLAVGTWAARVLAHPEHSIWGGRPSNIAAGADAHPIPRQPHSDRRSLFHVRSWRSAFAALARRDKWSATSLLWLWSAFVWALLLAAVCSPYSRAEGLKEALRWFEAFLIWLMAVSLARRPWQVAGLLICLLLAPAAEAAIGLAQFFAGNGPPSFRIAPDLPFVRAYGTIGQPNSFAGYMNMAWPLATAIAGFGMWELGFNAQSSIQNLKSKVILAVGSCLIALLLLAALAASLSRGAWVGAACGVVGIALAFGRRARVWSLAGLGLGALGLALGGMGVLPAVLADRLASITRYLTIFDAGALIVTPQNFAVVERMAHMQAGWRMFLAHPLTGVGPGNYTLAYPHVAVGTWYASRGHAHNYYIHMAAEAGIVGVASYLALLLGVIRQAIVVVRRNNRTIWRSAAIGCCGIIAAVAGHDLFENLHALSMGIQLAAVWALLVVLERPMLGE